MQILACSWFHVYINLLLLSLLLLLLHLIDDHDVTSFVTHSLIPKEEQREKVHNTSTCTVHVHIIHKVKHTHKYMYMYICMFVEDFLNNIPFQREVSCIYTLTKMYSYSIHRYMYILHVCCFQSCTHAGCTYTYTCTCMWDDCAYTHVWRVCVGHYKNWTMCTFSFLHMCITYSTHISMCTIYMQRGRIWTLDVCSMKA